MRCANTVITCATLAAVACLWANETGWRAERSLFARLEQRVRASPGTLVACPPETSRRVVILVLGQSNAGNHGAEERSLPGTSTSKVLVFDGHNCHRVSDPLPGATGAHRSVWSHVAARLSEFAGDRPLVFTLLAVESTTIADWTRSDRPVREALERLLAANIAMGLKPDIVVWQQGESDAQSGTSADDYASGLRSLGSIIRAAGIDAPIVAALSTRCGGHGPSAQIRSAIIGVASGQAGVRLGPDTDAIAGDMRNHDCHFSEKGLSAAAELWVDALARLLP